LQIFFTVESKKAKSLKIWQYKASLHENEVLLMEKNAISILI